MDERRQGGLFQKGGKGRVHYTSGDRERVWNIRGDSYFSTPSANEDLRSVPRAPALGRAGSASRPETTTPRRCRRPGPGAVALKRSLTMRS